MTGRCSPMSDCMKCGLSKGRKSVVGGDGPLDAAIAFIGEAPGEREDAMGKPFVGRSGKFLDSVLAANGIERRKVFITNVVRCRPPGNRRPSEEEMQSCRPFLLDELRKVRPKVVVTLGASALHSLTGFSGKLGEVVGEEQELTLSELQFSLVPCYHPSVAMRNRRMRAAFSDAVAKAIALSK